MENEPNKYPPLHHWNVGAYYYYRESMPSARLIVKVLDKREKAGWGIELDVIFVYDTLNHYHGRAQNRVGRQMTFSYKYGYYGGMYMWTMECLDLENLKDMTEISAEQIREAIEAFEARP